MAVKYLDSNGLLYFWGKVKAWVTGHATTRIKTGTDTFRSQENYTSGDDTLKQIDLSTDFAAKADKSATVSTVAYDGSAMKITKTINGTTTDVVTAAKIVQDGGGVTDISAKADKVTGATNGNFAGLDSNGNLTDSGHKHGDYKTKQTAKGSPNVPTSGTNDALAFIDTVSQDANGEITATKKNVKVVTASNNGTGGNNGLMLATDKEKLNGIEAGANNYTHPSATAHAAAAVKVGNDNKGHVVIGDALSKSDVGLGNVTNDSQVKRSEMGVANGVATLDGNGLVPSSQLPSYVDDVIEAYPRTGQTELSSTWLASGSASGSVIVPETGKIYVLMADSASYTTNTQFRWGGSTYVKLADGGVSAITNEEIDTICV